MEDVMYGVMFSANTDICKNEPPVTASKKLNASRGSVTMRHAYVKNAATLPVIGQLRSAMDEMDDGERAVVMEQLENILNSQPQGVAE